MTRAVMGLRWKRLLDVLLVLASLPFSLPLTALLALWVWFDDGGPVIQSQKRTGRHGRPFELVLAGPAGGRFTSGGEAGGEVIELDPTEFCRVVSGRSPGTGLLTTEVPF